MMHNNQTQTSPVQFMTFKTHSNLIMSLYWNTLYWSDDSLIANPNGTPSSIVRLDSTRKAYKNILSLSLWFSEYLNVSY